MAILPQEFDASGIPSLRPYLNNVLEMGHQNMLNLNGVRVSAMSSLLWVKNMPTRAGTILIKTSKRQYLHDV